MGSIFWNQMLNDKINVLMIHRKWTSDKELSQKHLEGGWKQLLDKYGSSLLNFFLLKRFCHSIFILSSAFKRRIRLLFFMNNLFFYESINLCLELNLVGYLKKLPFLEPNEVDETRFRFSNALDSVKFICRMWKQIRPVFENLNGNQMRHWWSKSCHFFHNISCSIPFRWLFISW